MTFGDLDSDGDGLTDRYELEIGTNSNDTDTDGDGLTDGEEILKFATDPLNPDSDGDGINDGPEVLQHNTNPLDPKSFSAPASTNAPAESTSALSNP